MIWIKYPAPPIKTTFFIEQFLNAILQIMTTFPGGVLCQGERADLCLNRAHPRRHHRPPSQDPLWQEARAELTLLGNACEM